MSRLVSQTRRILVTFLGWAVLLLGIVMIPYPGPGWITVFIGLSLLATEYKWANDVNIKARAKYDAWQGWLTAQPFYVKAIFWVLTLLTVIVTVWAVNGYGLINDWFDLGYDWVESPFVKVLSRWD